MKEEIRVGVEFLRQFLAKYGQLNQTQIDIFASKLSTLLEKRYVNHWYETQPMKGQAFRCLRLKRSEDYMDPVLEHILKETNLTLNQLGLPNDFTLWIDPGEVSVRFGDQVGYTYTIARLNTKEAKSLEDEISQSILENNETQEVPKAALIVENSNKIFNEKLTAFLRQNSCTNEPSQSSNLFINKTKEENEETLDDENVSSSLLNQLTALSAEKRTISPPMSAMGQFKTSSLIKRTNSSSIDINSSNINNKIKTEQLISDKMFNSPNGYNTNNNNNVIGSSILNSTNNQSNKISNNYNRLSYNDSCYFSSSSSSCASSFGSNHGDNQLAHLNWLKHDQQSSLLTPKPSFFEDKQDDLNQESFTNQFLFKPSSLYSNINNHMSLNDDITNEIDSKFSIKHNDSFGFGHFGSLSDTSFENFNSNINQLTSNNLFMNANNFGISNNPSNQNINNISMYSEQGSERSDTPSSCVTTASSLSCFMAPSSLSSSFTKINPFEESSTINVHKEDNLNIIGSSSTSTSSTVSDSNLNDSIKTSISTTPTKEKNKVTENEKPASPVSTLKGASSKPNKLATSPASNSDSKKKESKGGGSPGNNSANTSNSGGGGNSEESYCGYVESFPYYYKLNRLYNALAVQKMQTERLRKNAIINQSNHPGVSQTSTLNSPASVATAIATLASSASATSIGQAQLRNLTSKSSSPPSMLFSTTPEATVHQTPTSLKLSPSFNNSNNGSLIGSPSNKNYQFQPLASSPVSSYPNSIMNNNNGNIHMSKNLFNQNQQGRNQNGYPMSPTNAAISFANHQNRTSSHNRLNNYQQRQQSQQQQQQQQQSQIQQQNYKNMLQNNITNNSSSLFDSSFANLTNIANSSSYNNNLSSNNINKFNNGVLVGSANSFFSNQQQQLNQYQQQLPQQNQQQLTQNAQQQQQLFNSYFNQTTNWNRSQDLLKS